MTRSNGPAPGEREGAARVKIFFTGGTIAMSPAPGSGGVVPGVKATTLVEHLQGLLPGVEIGPVEWSDLPSPHMGPREMFRLAKEVEESLRDPGVAGAVVVHGTDVLEETAFMMDLVVDSEKPVILTGAMRYHDEPGYDGVRNLLYAVRGCLAREAQGMGAMVLMADRLFAAAEVTKVNSINVDSFDAPGHGPVGLVEGDELHFIRRPQRQERIPAREIEPNVDLILMSPGSDGRFVRCALERNAAGIVVVAFGAGNVPPGVVPALEEAIHLGIPVVVTSRCAKGGAWPIYGYAGGGRDLARKGMILGGRLPGEKARIKLVVGLGLSREADWIRDLFEGGGKS